ncbi:MAG: FtsW/RodA/SpoVE family cell cycle protein [Bacteroidales bacterium]|nr:FtsW/RodA/SpoVE family cell cycle protein [Bacteroidales bacterium]
MAQTLSPDFEDMAAQPAPAAAEAPAATKRRVRTDHHLWGTYILLVIIAVIELFSASIQEVADGEIFRPIIRHGMFLLAGLVLMIIMQKMHYRWIYAMIPLYVGASVAMMLWVMVGGREINGAQRAIELGGIQLLPAEFLKLAAALGMAWIISRNREPGKRDITQRGLVLTLGFLYLCCGLLFTQGLSNTIVVVAICFSMMLVCGVSWRKFIIALAITGFLGATGIYVKTSLKSSKPLTEQQIRRAQLNGQAINYDADGNVYIVGSGRGTTWKERVKRHFRPDKHLEAFSVDNQQEQLSYIAQAHGGLLGVGIGKSRENARLPLAFSDYIFAIIVEELGLFIGLGILLCYMWILGRSAMLTTQFRQTVPGMMVMGCAFVIVFQALFHMAIVSGVVPVSGQPLPLISKGGISVIATSLAFGVMLSVARHAARITDDKDRQEAETELLPENAVSENPAMVEHV